MLTVMIESEVACLAAPEQDMRLPFGVLDDSTESVVVRGRVSQSERDRPGLMIRGVFTEKGGVIGSAETCECVLGSPLLGVSAIHVKVTYWHHQFYWQDLSDQGTFFSNGERLPSGLPIPVQVGESYRIGSFRCVIEAMRSTESRVTDQSVPQDVYPNMGLASSPPRRMPHEKATLPDEHHVSIQASSPLALPSRVSETSHPDGFGWSALCAYWGWDSHRFLHSKQVSEDCARRLVELLDISVEGLLQMQKTTSALDNQLFPLLSWKRGGKKHYFDSYSSASALLEEWMKAPSQKHAVLVSQLDENIKQLLQLQEHMMESMHEAFLTVMEWASPARRTQHGRWWRWLTFRHYRRWYQDMLSQSAMGEGFFEQFLKAYALAYERRKS